MTLRLLTLLAGASTTALSVAAFALAAPTEKATLGLSFTTDASCTGEPIAFEGTMRLIRQNTENPNRWHFHGHVTEHLDGVGLLSGAKYIGMISGGVDVNVSSSANEAASSTLVSTVHIVRMGEPAPSDDYSEHILVRLTITATGEEQAFADAFRGGCA